MKAEVQRESVRFRNKKTTITVECGPGGSVSYFSKPVVVEGKLSVGETKEDGYVVNLFRVSCTSVQPAPGQ